MGEEGFAIGTDVAWMDLNGQRLEAEGGAAFDIINPADQSVVARVVNGATPEVTRAVDAAQAAPGGALGAEGD